MIKKLSSLTIKPNTEISKADLAAIAGSQLLESIVLSNAQFTFGCTLADLNIADNNELTSLNFVGSEGLHVPSIPTTNNQFDYNRPVPKSWSRLTKLNVVNLQHCGLSTLELNNFVKDFAERVNEGLGTATTSSRVLTINGQNAPLQISDSTVLAAKNSLIAKGWSVVHN